MVAKYCLENNNGPSRGREGNNLPPPENRIVNNVRLSGGSVKDSMENSASSQVFFLETFFIVKRHDEEELWEYWTKMRVILERYEEFAAAITRKTEGAEQC